MDIISHGLWGSVAFGRKRRAAFWLAFLFGIAPDFLSFGIFMLGNLLTGSLSLDHRGPPELSSIPSHIFLMYDLTHSLIVFSVIFGIVWLVRKRPFIPMLAWGLHILIDIPTHGLEYFPTPFLWPLSEYRFDGISWGHPAIFFSNIALLLIAYMWFITARIRDRRRNRVTV